MRKGTIRGIHQRRGDLNKVHRSYSAIVDIASIPDGVDLEQVIGFFNKTGVIIYDSKRGGDAPVIINSKTYIR